MPQALAQFVVALAQRNCFLRSGYEFTNDAAHDGRNDPAALEGAQRQLFYEMQGQTEAAKELIDKWVR